MTHNANRNEMKINEMNGKTALQILIWNSTVIHLSNKYAANFSEWIQMKFGKYKIFLI